MRRLNFLLCIILSILLLAACQDSTAVLQAESKPNTTDWPHPTPTAEQKTPEPAEESEELIDPYPLNTINVTGEIDEQTILDQDGVIIKALYCENDDTLGPLIWLSVENQRDKEISISSDEMSINGYMIPSSFFCMVKPGETETAYISYIEEDPFTIYGIDKIADIYILFEVTDAASFDTVFLTDAIPIITNLSGQQTQPADLSGITLFDDGEYKIVYRGITDTNGIDPTVNLYIENNTDHIISLITSDFDLNQYSYVYSPIFWCSLLPGTKTIEKVPLITSELDELGVSELADMEFYMPIYDRKTSKDYAYAGPFYIEMESGLIAAIQQNMSEEVTALTVADPTLNLSITLGSGEWAFSTELFQDEIFFYPKDEDPTKGSTGIAFSSRQKFGSIEQIWNAASSNMEKNIPEFEYEQKDSISVGKYIANNYHFKGKDIIGDYFIWEAEGLIYICSFTSDSKNYEDNYNMLIDSFKSFKALSLLQNSTEI